MNEIKQVRSRSILDSRGNPTVETDIYLKDTFGRAAVPSGASTGSHEALELRDGGRTYHGKGVENAVKNVNDIIAPKLIGLDVTEQRNIDELMLNLDGTDRKTKLGANAILSCSMAIAVAAAKQKNISVFKYIGELTSNDPKLLPVPSMNVINGGEHADNNLDIQEHMILPIGAKSFRESVQMCAEVYFELKRLLKERYGAASINVGDEGGFAPPISEPNQALEVIIDAIDEMGYSDKIKLGLDCAASEFYNDKEKYYTINNTNYSSEKLIEYYGDLIDKYPIISIEDPFAEDDWEGFSNFTQRFGHNTQVVGDDLFVTNVERLKKGFSMNACNCLLLKVNQIGSLTEACDASNMAIKNGYNVMVSHRSGETEDCFIADLVVGLQAGQIKSGAPARSDRTAKYNQLLRIEEELGSNAQFAANRFFK